MEFKLGDSMGPYLEVVNHTSLFEEKVTKYGQTYDAHVVVKNSPFVIALALRNCRTHDFNHLAFDVQLLYDMPPFDKLVPFVTTKPIEFKSAIAGEHSTEISFDVKIKVLSSHHEDNFFRLNFQVWDPLEKSTFKPLSIVSAAIKVISKPLKPKGPKVRTPVPKPRPATAKRKAADLEADDGSDPDEMLLDAPGALLSPAAEETLQQVAQQQRETLDILRQLASRTGVSAPSIADAAPPPPSKRPRLDGPPSPDDFEGAFSTMLQAYSAMSAELKAEKVRRLVRALPTRDGEILEELFDVLATQGVQVAAGTRFSGHQHTEACAPDCQHREELQRVEEFFNEVFY